MVSFARVTVSRRQVLLGAAATCLPAAAMAGVVYTPHELREQYRRAVLPRLHPPADEVRLYGGIAEMQLFDDGQELLEPQYLLVIDANPHVQAALLFWRLLPGSYELVGASPVSTSLRQDERAIAQGLFDQAPADSPRRACTGESCARGAQRVYEFGWRPPARAFALGPGAGTRLQVRAADAAAQRRLGSPSPANCILLPPTLISFLDEYGVLDEGVARAGQRHVLPWRGRHLMVVDSERDDRPAWSPAPPHAPRAVARAGR